LGVGRGATTPPHKTFLVTKPHTEDCLLRICQAAKEEEEEEEEEGHVLVKSYQTTNLIV
jgi:hypothetical protein